MSLKRTHDETPIGEPSSSGSSVKRFSFSINSINEQTKFPTFSKPNIIGAFSLNSDREYVEGLHGLKYVQLPPDLKTVRYDLDEARRKQELNQRTSGAMAHDEIMHQQTNELIHLIDWINRHKDQFMQRKPHFVFYRGLISKLLNTSYETREGWKIGAVLKTGTIYLHNIDTEEVILKRHEMANDPRQCQMTSWGYIFEDFLLSDEPTSQPDRNPNFSNLKSGECNLVFESQLGNHNLLYAAEVDGVWLPAGENIDLKSNFSQLKNHSLVELKTTRQFPPNGMTRNFRRFNLRKWWSQSFTVGVSHVIAGLRDDDGVVNELKIFTIKDLSREGREWSPTVCFNFLLKFLDQVKAIVQNDESYWYTIEFIPQRWGRMTFQVEVFQMNVSPSQLKNIL